MGFDPLQSFSKYSGVQQDSNSQSEGSLRSVEGSFLHCRNPRIGLATKARAWAKKEAHESHLMFLGV
jgi:hypothetical protein